MSEPVVVALISIVPPSLGALGVLLQGRRTARHARHAADSAAFAAASVHPNGQGTVTQMLELVIHEQRRQGAELAELRLEDRNWRAAHERDHHTLGV